MNRPQLLRCKCIALIGAGGKSTLATALCLALPGQNAFTTTTHAFFPDALHALQCPDDAQLDALFSSGRSCAVLGETVAEVNGRIKAGPPSEATFARLRANCDHLLIEADGAAGRLLKLHRSHEPVVPDYVDAVLSVCGMDALGRPLARCCHRAADVEARLGKPPESLCTEEDIVRCMRLACAPFPKAAAVLNAAADLPAARRVQSALEKHGLPCCIVPACQITDPAVLFARAAAALLTAFG